MSREVLEFAERGVYSCRGDVTGDTFRDQKKSIFERLTDEGRARIGFGDRGRMDRAW
jgi:hypothetical protein